MKRLILAFAAAGMMGAGAALAAEPTPLALDRGHTALVVTDPQNEFLSENGKLYKLMADNLKAVGTVENLERLFKAAGKSGMLIAVDPLAFAPGDAQWTHAGALQRQLLDMKALGAGTPGAEIHDRFKPYLADGKALMVAAHKMYGPESNDLIYQLRARGIDTVVLAGLVANLCVDSHLRALMENGFKVYVVKDAVAAPGEDAYKAALVAYSMIANGVLTTEEAVKAMAP
ncbi:cysteine hydrolase [Zavarzinia sp.]|uniref:cysteine hydrolase n=1 Tax=Zavarzinia sp. TaxID=2027920 RepID=UPI003567E75D